jgi:hypothetical protein
MTEPEVMPLASSPIAEYSPTAAKLAEIREQLAGKTFDCTTPAGDREARQTRRVLVELRTGIEAKRQELKAPILEQGRLLDAEARRITGQIVEMESPIDAVIRAEEARKEAIRVEAERKEAARVAANKAEIDAIRDAPLAYLRQPAADIQAEIQRLQGIDLDLIDEDFRDQAQHTRQITLGQLIGMQERAAEAERQAAALAEERAENERIRAQAAERERQQEEAHQRELAERAEAERIEREKRDAADAEFRRQAAAEQQRTQNELAAARAAEQKRLDDEAEAQRQAQAEADRQEAERLEGERQRQEQTRQAAWQAHLLTITLREAAQRALEHIEAEQGADYPIAQELRAALTRDAAPATKPARKSRAKKAQA